MVKEFLFEDRTNLFAKLAADCRDHLAKAVATQGEATLMVSGGSTPEPLYKALSMSDLDWEHINVALVDERWVDPDHSASNAGLIYRSLLVNEAKQAPFVGMKTEAATASAGRTATETLYFTLPQPFTASILGMGSDGHTASLFPHAEGLDEALAEDGEQLTAAIIAKQSDVTGPNTERLTLTLTGLLKSERLIVLLTGEDKLTVFRKAMADGSVEEMPIRAVLRQSKVPVELYWAP